MLARRESLPALMAEEQARALAEDRKNALVTQQRLRAGLFMAHEAIDGLVELHQHVKKADPAGEELHGVLTNFEMKVGNAVGGLISGYLGDNSPPQNGVEWLT